jgi:hypothetical protein
LLLLAVACYLAVLVTTWLGLVAIRRRATSRRGLWQGVLWTLAVAEILYVLQAPACVYLPRAPGSPAVRRQLIGADSAGDVYWIEGKCPLGFAFGPRWWFVMTGHTLDGGFEFVPWMRFAWTDDVWGRRSQGSPRLVNWEVVGPQGWRRAYDQEHGAVAHVLEADRSIVSFAYDGVYRLPSTGGPWVFVGRYDGRGRGRPRDLKLLPNGTFLEVYEAPDTHLNERRRDITFVEREVSGKERRHVSMSLIEESRIINPGDVRVFVVPDALILIHTWLGEGLVGQGRTYRLSRTLSDLQPLGAFQFTAVNRMSLAASPDGRFFTDGTSVFRIGGDKVRSLEAPLSSCIWVGNDLHGIRRYPFFGSLVTWRQNSLRGEIAGARVPASRTPPSRELPGRVAAGVAVSATWNGFDEAAREDEIVRIGIQ